MLLGPVAVLAKVTLNDWGNYAAIVAAVAAVALLVAGVWQSVRRKLRLRNPIEATYLIPKEEYERATFPGALEDEQYVKQLSVAPNATYEVFHRLTAMQGLILDSVQLSFWGPRESKPANHGPVRPWERDSRLDERGERMFMDWHGGWHPDRPLPHMVPKGQHVLAAHTVQVVGEWNGSAKLRLTLRAEESEATKEHEVDMPFRVLEGRDQVPFLRRQG